MTDIYVEPLARKITIEAIAAYKTYISPYKGFACAHRLLHGGESCSTYIQHLLGEKSLMSAVQLSRQRFKADRNYEAFTPITMELPEEGGIEPDYCFYIDNWQAVVGRDHLEWGTDPSPDLVIEIDVTTYTNANDYALYRVPEVWLLK